MGEVGVCRIFELEVMFCGVVWLVLLGGYGVCGFLVVGLVKRSMDRFGVFF